MRTGPACPKSPRPCFWSRVRGRIAPVGHAVTACNTVELAAARADPVVEHGRPERLPAVLHHGRLQDIRRADADALAALDAARKELLLGHGAGRPYERGCQSVPDKPLNRIIGTADTRSARRP